MKDLITLLERSTAILREVDASNLSADLLHKSKSELENLIAAQVNSIPNVKDNTGDESEETSDETLKVADTINKKADVFNDELDRIKKIRATLNLDALDPLIDVSRQFIHRVYNYTSALE